MSKRSQRLVYLISWDKANFCPALFLWVDVIFVGFPLVLIGSMKSLFFVNVVIK